MPLDLDPITQTYRAIRDALIAWPQWGTAMEPRPGAGFRPGNFPDLSESTWLKPMLAPADKPMALLTEGAFTLRPFGRNSLTATIEQTFPLVYEIGTLKLLSANRIKFETMRAMLNAGESLSQPGFRHDMDVAAGQRLPLRRCRPGDLQLIRVGNHPANRRPD
jgi:hypothetical protein